MSSLTLFGMKGCAGAAELREYLATLGVPFADEVLGPRNAPAMPGGSCCFVSPSLRFEDAQGTDLLVQPTKDEVFAALRRSGNLRSRPAR